MFFSPANARVALSNTSSRQSTSSNPEANMSSSSSSNEEVTSLMLSLPGISGMASIPSSSNGAAELCILDVENSNQFGSAASSGRSTPVTTSGRNTPVVAMTTVLESGNTESVKAGRERGAFAYSANEHLALLVALQSTPNSFNVGEGCDEWRSAYQELATSYYHPNNRMRMSSTLLAHFVELYSAFKAGIRTLFVLPNSPKCPSSVSAANQKESEFYIKSLHSLLLSDKKKFQPSKWWSFEVVNLLLVLHLEHMKRFGSDNQSVQWLLGKAEKAKGKFDMDQKNWEAEIDRKRKLKEEEAKEAAQNRKVVAESSAKMCQTMEGSMQIFEGIAQSIGHSSDIDDKLTAIQQNIMTDVQRKLDEKFSSFLNVMKNMLGRKG
jgi:hypothetical protein